MSKEFNNNKIYYAKIMLFGEYSVIKNSMALTVPYRHFNGELRFIHRDNYTDYDFAQRSNLNLYNLLGYIKEVSGQNRLLSAFDLDAFAGDLKHGLYFESSIPEGYGVGSSGALIAAIYNRYVKDRPDPTTLDSKGMASLKNKLAQLESFYHGTSSGIDPLNAYMKHPLLFSGKGEVDKASIHLPAKNPEFAVFLLNTGLKRETGPLVNIFLERAKNKEAGGVDAEHLIGLTNQAIHSIMKGANGDFFQSLQGLSNYQFRHFEPMIPQGYRHLWKEGIDNNHYYLKLCGSGGGGFLLGFTDDFPGVRHKLGKKGLELIPVYMP
ncbi:MAG: hypothetical protein KGY60_01420 [Bacteroidales bacterium]|nr:hypothetical protein [Bacteroidales bacterium]